MIKVIKNTAKTTLKGVFMPFLAFCFVPNMPLMSFKVGVFVPHCVTNSVPLCAAVAILIINELACQMEQNRTKIFVISACFIGGYKALICYCLFRSN